MSHFSVMVIGDDVDGQMAPFHEFECTGHDDGYVQTIDKTAEARAEFQSDTTTRYKDPEGKLHNPYEDRFYRVPLPEEKKLIGPAGGSGGGHGLSWHSKDWGDGLGHSTRVHFIPDGWQEVRVNSGEIQTFLDWVQGYYGWNAVPYGSEPDLSGQHKYGYVTVDADGEVDGCFDRTNPNAKWDWYVVGGRWSNRLLLKDGTRADQAPRGDIDFDTMIAKARSDAMKTYNRALKAAGGVLRWTPWKEIVAEVGKAYPTIEEARKAYNGHPGVSAAREALGGFFVNPDELLVGLEAYVATKELEGISTFAVVKDGEWLSRGEMGWFGMSTDTTTSEDWTRDVLKMIQDLPDHTLITIVDCHV